MNSYVHMYYNNFVIDKLDKERINDIVSILIKKKTQVVKSATKTRYNIVFEIHILRENRIHNTRKNFNVLCISCTLFKIVK